MASSNSRRERRQQKKEEEQLIDLVEARDKAQSIYEKNQALLLGVLTVGVLIIGGVFAYNNFYKAPRNEKAISQMSQAQMMFERDSFQQALFNPGGLFPGFEAIADEYGGTKAGNLANYYAAICYLNMGEYAAALDYLNSYKPQDEVTPIMKFGAMGDAFSELNDFDNALKYYQKAVDQGENDFLVPYYMKKIGLLHERNGEFTEARAIYEEIKKEYPTSTTGSDIQKYITRVEGK